MPLTRILIVDDEADLLEVCLGALAAVEGVHVETESQSARAEARLDEGWDLLLLDIRMPAPDGMELLARAREVSPDTTVIMITAHPTIDTAVEAIKRGAFDYVPKPFMPDQLRQVVRRAIEHRRMREENALLSRHVERSYAFDDILSRSPRMHEVFDVVDRVAATGSEVLLCGESGTGKELVARSLHLRSPRRSERFVPIDCGSIPETLLESELFGHQKGAFTGAISTTIGLFEFAQRGTLFLDEICEIPLPLQAKLLRVLQEREVRRIGGRGQVPVDIRVVAATNRDIDDEVREGRFREDLYYRINVVRIELPPLRERAEDIPLLATHFAERFAREWGRSLSGMDPAAMEVLAAYPWPGNVRELQNVIKRAVALVKGDRLTVDDLPAHVVEGTRDNPAGGFASRRAERMASFEREAIKEALTRHGGDASAALAELGIPKATFYRLLRRHNLRPEAFRPPQG